MAWYGVASRDANSARTRRWLEGPLCYLCITITANIFIFTITIIMIMITIITIFITIVIFIITRLMVLVWILLISS